MSERSTRLSRDFVPDYGQAICVAPNVRRIIARNPSAMTFTGTNTYIVGQSKGMAVIDPGPDDAQHLQAILGSVPDPGAIDWILITHNHSDHSMLAPKLAAETGANVLAHRFSVPSHEATVNAFNDREGVDNRFQADDYIGEGAVITGDGWTLQALWTPGHFRGHICFSFPDSGVLFSGDHVMGWSTSVVSPPQGSMTDYMRSLERLIGRSESIYLPGHGDRISNPQDMLQFLINHRREREGQIIETLKRNAMTASEVAGEIYDIQPEIMPAAARNVFAHFLDLQERGIVKSEGEEGFRAKFKILNRK